jgi:hypothetical protein
MKPDFDWNKLTWGRPDSQPTALCSACSAALNEDDVHLIVWTEGGYSARFCPPCGELAGKALLVGSPGAAK